MVDVVLDGSVRGASIGEALQDVARQLGWEMPNDVRERLEALGVHDDDVVRFHAPDAVDDLEEYDELYAYAYDDAATFLESFVCDDGSVFWLSDDGSLLCGTMAEREEYYS